MLVLFETAAGFAVFRLLDENKLSKVEDLFEDFETPEQANKVVQLVDFKKFADSADALQAGVALNEGKLCKPLKKLLKKVFQSEAQEQLLVWDAKLGNSIKDKMGFPCVATTAGTELMRCIKSQVEALIPGLKENELSAMSLGLAHNLARYKLKFSPDKVDTMIVQAVSLLDDIDKELNNYIMRSKEWYGWHFPELAKIVTDNIPYIKSVLLMGTREKAVNIDFSDILPEDIEEKLKVAAEMSMGTEITDDDLMNIQNLCEQVLELTEYRAQLYEYLQNRMVAIAPNLTILVGELVGARLIAHAGSLINLAKHPASTIQILGAEKALFRALKTKHATPKYGLIYHAHMVGQTSVKNKGKMSRMLSAKAALACRYDALGEEITTDMAVNNRAKLHSRMKMLEDGFSHKISGKGKTMARNEKYQGVSEVSEYPVAADSTLESSSKRKFDEDFEEEKPKKLKVMEIKAEPTDSASETGDGEKKKKKKKKKEQDSESPLDTTVEVKEESMETETGEKKKKKKKVKQEEEVKEEPMETGEKKKKKKKSKQEEDD